MGILDIIYLCSFISAAYSQNTMVNTNYGRVQGFSTTFNSKQLVKFLGIPFAKPPIGSLRLMKPEKPEKWTDVKQTIAYSPSCYELYKFPEEFLPGVSNYTYSEDCLYLNIFVPGSTEAAKSNPKAVMVWIYGGGWMVGNANTYLGDSLAATEDVIVVTFNYRLGLFGLMAIDDKTIPGNVFLFDQLAALEWVNENIVEFGGDSTRITIFGESAGADSVYNHLVSPLSKNLFSRAIIQSTPTMSNLPSKADQYAHLKESIKDICSTENSHTLLQCLQDLPTEDFRKLSDGVGISLQDIVTLDGEFLTDHPAKLISKGDFDKSKEVIVGYMTDDGDVMLIPDLENYYTLYRTGLNMNDAKTYINFLLGDMYFHRTDMPNSKIMTNLLYQKYFSCNMQSPYDIVRGLLNMSTDCSFAARAFEIARDISKHGGKVYLYEFEHLLNYYKQLMNANMEMFAGHGHDLIFLFDFLTNIEAKGHEVTQKEKKLSLSFMKAFAEFARTGQPKYLTNSNDEVVWKPYNDVTRMYVKFTDEMTSMSLQSVPEHKQRRIELWNSVLTGIQNIQTCDAYTGHGGKPMPNKGISCNSGNMASILLVVFGVILCASNLN